MKEIGGFLGLELHSQNDLHRAGLGFNSARSALLALLKHVASSTKRQLKVALPTFLCPDVLSMLRDSDLNMDIQLYNLSEELKPLSYPNHVDIFYYYNVFGLTGAPESHFAKWMIIDNVHAFFEAPVSNGNTIYSARKFIGVPDGAFLYTSLPIKVPRRAESWGQCAHLLRRVDVDATSSYLQFREAEEALSKSPILSISKLSKEIINSLDVKLICKKRLNNFEILHEKLKSFNKLSHVIDRALERESFVPFMYPLLVAEGNATRARLVENKIFSPKLWASLASTVETSSFEKHLVEDTLHLPVDQRYGCDDMNLILTNLSDLRV